jgi:uncharacterized protein involved in exopolysaccharide biosynthesis
LAVIKANDEIERMREQYEQTRAELASALRQCREAAAEIERLRAELAKSQNLASIALERVTESKVRRP